MPLQKDLAALLNSYSAENGSNTPDAVLADYLLSCLEAFNTAVRARTALLVQDNAGQYPEVAATPGPREYGFAAQHFDRDLCMPVKGNQNEIPQHCIRRAT